MTYVPKVNFHSIESIIAPIPRSREDVVKDILACKDLIGMQKFMEQTDEKCVEDVEKAIEQARVTKAIVADLTGTKNSAFYWKPKRLSTRKGYKEDLCAIYLNCIQRPELFKELSDVSPKFCKRKFTWEQTQELQKFYEKNRNPTKIEREKIAQSLTLMTPDCPRNEQSVMTWFQKRRKVDKDFQKQLEASKFLFASSLLSTLSSSGASSSTSTTPFIDLTTDE